MEWGDLCQSKGSVLGVAGLDQGYIHGAYEEQHTKSWVMPKSQDPEYPDLPRLSNSRIRTSGKRPLVTRHLSWPEQKDEQRLPARVEG